MIWLKYLSRIQIIFSLLFGYAELIFLSRSKILFCKLEVSNINTGKGNIVEINEDHLNEDKQRLVI